MPPPQQTYETALEHLLAEAGGVFAAADVAALMGISQAAVHNRVKLGRAIGFIRRGHLVLPKIQFVQTRQGTSTILEGVDAGAPRPDPCVFFNFQRLASPAARPIPRSPDRG